MNTGITMRAGYRCGLALAAGAALGLAWGGAANADVVLRNLDVATGSGTGFFDAAHAKSVSFRTPGRVQYALDAATLAVTINAASTPVVEMRTGQGLPTTLYGTLQSPAVATGNMRFTARGIRLYQASQYWLHARAVMPSDYTWLGGSPQTLPSGPFTVGTYILNNAVTSGTYNRFSLEARPIVVTNVPGAPVTTLGTASALFSGRWKACAWGLNAGEQDVLLDSVDLDLRLDAGGALEAALWTGVGQPATQVAALAPVGTVAGEGLFTFRPAAAVRLTPGTQYWTRVISNTGQVVDWRASGQGLATSNVATPGPMIFSAGGATGSPSSLQNSYAVLGAPIITANIQGAAEAIGTTVGLTTESKDFGFTVGGARGLDFLGATLTLRVPAGVTPRVELWAGGATPTTQLQVLRAPTAYTADVVQDYRFEASRPERLAAGQSYWLRAQRAGTGGYEWVQVNPNTLPTGVAANPRYLFNGAASGVYNRVAVLGSWASCAADFNGDGQVDDVDFVLFAQQYDLFVCSAPGMPAGCAADLDDNGQVDDVDFVLFAQQYDGFVCP